MTDGEGDEDVSSLVARAVELSTQVLDSLEADDADGGDTADLLDELEAIAAEATELLDAMDLSELPSAIDPEGVDEVVDEEQLPEAVANLDPGEAIRLRKLLAVVDIGELWSSVDVRDVWQNKREFEDAVDEFTDDEGDDDVSALVSEFTDDEGDGDDEDDDFDVDVDVGETLSTDDDVVDLPDAAYQTAIQQQLSETVGEFRQKLVDLHRDLARLREENRQRTDRVGQPDSRNPTAHSTLASTRTAGRGDTTYSTVPAETKYSNAPNRRRVYGDRFEEYGGDDA
ncbi:hypothetical protein [Halogeometricum limi]|uniref:Uncharacterized protein n=1 Tax=Halogeometricum limi TaxID=555875 RepID=A0A1I6GU59_9EURY|nr:hypothetical protein [Halogeometricum limi]SFR45775.1 hypothetical protein SAMN04488124_1541 [Halogeometricum limi]